MPRASIPFDNGNMPFEFYIKKMEMTDSYDSPFAVENYQRDLMKNFDCDAPFLESDMPRRNNLSEQFLNLRAYGSRSEYTPQLPDGTFLDFEFTERDPRGYTQEYNWSKFNSENATRFYNKPFTNDNYFSTHDGPLSDNYINTTKKDMDNEFRQRWKNFNTSKDGWTGGRLGQNKIGNDGAICKIATEQNNYMMEEGLCYNNTNIVPKLSDNTVVGYNTTPDQEFKIASYSQVKSTRSLAEDDWNRNRRNTYIDRDLYVKYKDNIVPSSIALNMIDLSQKKYNEMQSARNYKFANSQFAGTRTQNYIKNALENSAQTEAALPQGPLAETDFYSRGAAPIPKMDSNMKLKSKATQVAAETISNYIRKHGKVNSEDVRKKVAFSIVNPDSHAGAPRSNGPVSYDNSLMWESIQDKVLNTTGERLLANFHLIKPKVYSRTDEINNVVFDDYKAPSAALDTRQSVFANKMDRHTNVYTKEANFQDSDMVNNASTFVGSKYLANQMIRENNQHEIFDL